MKTLHLKRYKLETRRYTKKECRVHRNSIKKISYLTIYC